MTAPPTPAPAPTDLAAQVRAEVDKITASKSWRVQMERLVREKVTAEAEVTRLKAAAPKVEDGGQILTKAEAEEFAAFKKLNIKPSEVSKLQTDFATLQGKETERTEEEQFAEAAEVLEWKNAPAVTRFLKREGLHLEFKDVKTKGEDGKTVVTRTPMVRDKKDDKAALQPLGEYVEEQFPDILDIFTKEPKAKGEGEESSAPEPVGGLRIPSVPGARPPAVTKETDAKKIEKMTTEAQSSGMYSL
jgi:hypothetical protein